MAMGRMGKLGNAVLAGVLAMSLTLPTSALAFAASGGGAGLAAASLAPEAPAPLDANAQVWDGTVDVSWYVADANASEWTLTKPAQLAGLAALVNGTTSAASEPLTFAGKTIKLGDDIWLNAVAATGRDTTGSQLSWTPIGDLVLTGTEESSDGGTMPHYADGHYFDGTFDGQGHVVKNLYIYNNVEGTYGGDQALFANVGGHAVIENTGIDGGWVYGRVAAGLVAVSHVMPEKDADGNTVYPVPHIIGCFNGADVRGNGSTTRGLAGIFAGEEQYRGESDTQEENYHGGAYIANCYNTGTISAAAASSNSTGGIVGTGDVKIYGCYNYGDIEIESRYAAAIAGNLTGSGINVGQDSTIGYAAGSVVADSFARENCIPADDQGYQKLYNLMDATHGKGQAGARNPYVLENDTSKFQAASWFAGGESSKALSQSFVAGAVCPQLYWQADEGQWDINKLDEYDQRVYWIEEVEPQMYTGSPLMPTITMRYDPEDDGNEVDLHQGSDFTVEYADNVEVSEHAKVTVTGLGRFYNGRTVEFGIIDGDLSKVTLSSVSAQWWYGPNTVNPEIKVTAPNGDELKAGIDYELTFEGIPASSSGFSDGKATAKAKVTAKDGGKYAFPAGTTEITREFTVLEAATSLSGDGTEASPYQVGTKGELQFLAWATSFDEWATYGDKYGADDAHFQVIADIDATSSDSTYMTDRPCDPLFSYYSGSITKKGGLGGTFDGNGKTITLGQTEEGLSLDLYEALALFVYTKSGGKPTIKDLTIDGSVYAPNGAAAGLLIMGQSGELTIEGCVNKAKVQGDQAYFGAAAGLVVQTSNSASTTLVMKDCKNAGTVTSATRAAGIVASLGAGKATIEGCSNAGAVTAGSTGGAGGIAALILGADKADDAFGHIAFSSCANTGAVTIKSGGDAGGIVGWNQEHVKGIEFNRCSNTGTVTYRGAGCAGAGIMGRAYSPALFKNCYNNAAIVNVNNADVESAGILGYAAAETKTGEHYASYADADGNAADYTFMLQNVYSAGGFGVHAAKAGGLVGYLWLHQTLEFDNCYYESGTGAATKAISYDWGAEWPSAVDPSVVNGDAVQMDDAAMQDPTFASMLGGAFAADEQDATSGKYANGGFPVLVAAGGTTAITNLVEGGFSISAPAEFSYTGAAIALSDLIVENTAHDVLKQGSDYVVFYSAEGTRGTAIVQGIGKYTGTLEHTFEIKPCDLSKCRISQVKGVNYTDFAGTCATQEVMLVNPAGLAMTEGVDYEVLYANNTAPGRAYLMAKGKSPYYTGTILRIFTIAAGDLSQIQVRGLQAHYPLATGSGGLYIYERLTAANGFDLKRSDSYVADEAGRGDYVRLFYSYNEETGEYDTPVWANGSASEGWATHVTEAGRYRVELRGDGESHNPDGTATQWTNGRWTGRTSATFTYGNRMESDEDVLVSGLQDCYGPAGEDLTEQVKPTLTSKITGYTLYEEKAGASSEYGYDYRISFEWLNDETGKYEAIDKVEKAGDYRMLIEGVNNWFGTREVSFEVASPNVFISDKTTVTGIASQYFYTGKAIRPVPKSVQIDLSEFGLGAIGLEAGEEYSVSYADANGKAVAAPTDAGAYYAVITGEGDYRGSTRVKFTIEKPVMKVYVKKGAGTATLAKQYTKDQFVKLKAADSAANPVSALYCDMGGSNWSVASTNSYVALAGLLKDAGVTWASGASMNYAAGGFTGKAYTYDQVNSLMYYPSTTATAVDTFGGKKAPFVLSLTDFSSGIGRNETTFAAEAEEFNLNNLDGSNMPRAIMGVAAADYKSPAKNASKMMGSRLVKGVDSITVTLPASPLTAAAKSKTLTATCGKGATFAASKAYAVSGAKGVVAYAKKSGNSKIAVASNGTITVSKTLAVGSYPVTVAVTDPGKGAYQEVTKSVSFTVKVSRAANPITVRAKAVAVAAGKSLAAGKAIAVSGAKGPVSYAKASGAPGIAVSRSGSISVKKGTAKKTYSIKVNVTAAGNATYAPATKSVTVRVTVR